MPREPQITPLAMPAQLFAWGEHTTAQRASTCAQPPPGLSFLCEGAVPELFGLLRQRLGRPREASRQLELAVQHGEGAGLMRSAAEARLALTLCRESVPAT